MGTIGGLKDAAGSDRAHDGTEPVLLRAASFRTWPGSQPTLASGPAASRGVHSF